jgi:hypothetical protein
MIQNTLVKIDIPVAVGQFKLPKAVNNRLQELLDRQDKGEKLTTKEKDEAAGLVNLAEVLSLLQLRAKNVENQSLEESANLYAEIYAEDAELQKLNSK